MSSFDSSNGFELLGVGSAFKEELTEMIASTQLFSDFEWPDIEVLANFVQCYEVRNGTVIFKEGDTGSYMCLVVKGNIEILKENQDGTLQQMATVRSGKMIGEMSIIDGEPRSATCIARERSVVLLLTKDNYAKIIKERPALAYHILSKLAKSLSQRLRGVSGKLVELLGHD